MKLFTSLKTLTFRALMLCMLFVFGLVSNVQAAADADVTSTVTTFTDSFAAIKTPILTVVIFGIVLGLIKMLRRGK